MMPNPMRYVFWFFLFAMHSVFAEVTEDLRYRYFDVNVLPGQSLYKVLMASRPNDLVQIDGSGSCQSMIESHYSINRSFNSCRVSSVRVQLSSVITLPILDSASESQKQSFVPYDAASRVHELGHYRIDREYARATDAFLNSIPAYSDCTQLTERISYGLEKLKQSQREVQIEYDRVTQHGILQGTVIHE